MDSTRSLNQDAKDLEAKNASLQRELYATKHQILREGSELVSNMKGELKQKNNEDQGVNLDQKIDIEALKTKLKEHQDVNRYQKIDIEALRTKLH